MAHATPLPPKLPFMNEEALNFLILCHHFPFRGQNVEISFNLTNVVRRWWTRVDDTFSEYLPPRRKRVDQTTTTNHRGAQSSLSLEEARLSLWTEALTLELLLSLSLLALLLAFKYGSITKDSFVGFFKC